MYCKEGFDAVVAKAPDLTKVIPGAESAINAAITGISTSPMVPVGKYSSARLPGVWVVYDQVMKQMHSMY